MADASDSKSDTRKGVKVQVLSPAVISACRLWPGKCGLGAGNFFFYLASHDIMD